MLKDEQPSPERIKVLRAMTGEERLMEAERLFWADRKAKIAQVRSDHPDWPEVKVIAEVNRIILSKVEG